MPILFTDNSNMFIDHQKGSIGIGTNSSTSNLHVVGQTFLNGNLTVSGITSITTLSVSGSGISGILNTVSQPNITSLGTLTGLTVAGTGITGTLNTATQRSITLLGTLTNLTVNTGLFVSSTGNVGIGTPTPNANLHVVGPVNLISSEGSTGMFVRLGNVGIGTSTPNANLHVTGYTQIMGTTGNSGLFVDTIGEVGINTSVPTSNLHVLGTTQIFGTAGTTGLFVDRLGNVGIAQNAPNANLHVVGPVNLISSDRNTGLYMRLGNVGIGTSVPSGNLHVLGHTQLLGLAGTSGLYVSNVGNVGIGSTNPQYSLDIIGTMRCGNVSVFQGAAATSSTYGVTLGMEGQHCCIQLNANVGNDTYVDFSSTNNDYLGRIFYSSTANVMIFSTRLTEKMRIDAGGNVGIGLTPTYKLDVSGTANITGPIYSAGKQVPTISTYTAVFTPSAIGIGTTSISVTAFSYAGIVSAYGSNGDLSANPYVYFISVMPVFNGVSPSGTVNQMYVMMNVLSGGVSPCRINVCAVYYPV
jgi:hypothetical protein